MKTVITLNTSGYEVEEKTISKITLADLKKGIVGKERNGNFHAYGVKNDYIIRNSSNGIEIKKTTISDVKEWLKNNSI